MMTMIKCWWCNGDERLATATRKGDWETRRVRSPWTQLIQWTTNKRSVESFLYPILSLWTLPSLLSLYYHDCPDHKLWGWQMIFVKEMVKWITERKEAADLNILGSILLLVTLSLPFSLVGHRVSLLFSWHQWKSYVLVNNKRKNVQ